MRTYIRKIGDCFEIEVVGAKDPSWNSRFYYNTITNTFTNVIKKETLKDSVLIKLLKKDIDNFE